MSAGRSAGAAREASGKSSAAKIVQIVETHSIRLTDEWTEEQQLVLSDAQVRHGAFTRVGQVKQSRRRVVVFTSLIGVLTFTSALLLALAPAPLTPDAASSLFAVDAPDSMDAIFQTEVAPASGRWKYIYIHHSRSPGGNAITLGQETGGLNDHFVIGNGDGALDGEIQVGQRWNRQLSANPPAGATSIDPACISICVIGDFDRTVPTPMQIRRLAQLVGALQGRFHISGSKVLVFNQANSPAGSGKYFPMTGLREQLLP